ncbi:MULTISPECIES: hypothetical protein [unclassified Alteromonas]|uniref:hypothetical protein n=1 Tax=unclassified Alteromonas TaxID=2614992 RepID=UPI0005099C19|nr:MULTISPECIES: hypothetical protein [unclassified Alteromonas]
MPILFDDDKCFLPTKPSRGYDKLVYSLYSSKTGIVGGGGSGVGGTGSLGGGVVGGVGFEGVFISDGTS